MRGVEQTSNFAWQDACLIRCGSQRNFTIAANVEPNAVVVKPVVGIDLFARRCIEGVQLTMTARPVTQPPHLAKRQPRQADGFGALVAVSSATVQKGFSAMNFRILAASARPRKR